jgi:aldose 1-epimerase
MNDKFLTLHSADGKLSLDLCPSVGGCITAFRKHAGGKTVDLMRAYDPKLPLDPLNFSSFPLTPFSNRIGYARLSFQGKTFEVGPPFGGEPHPNHGDGWHTAWTVAEESANRAVLTLKTQKRPDSPYVYEAKQTFTLEGGALTIDMEITNNGKEALPFGTGHHPYFNRTDQTILKAGLKGVWTSKNMVPDQLTPLPAKWDFNKGVALDPAKIGPAQHGGDGSAYIDHCFTGWSRKAEITWPEYDTKLRITADPVYGNFVIFVPSKGDFFCAEPVTNVTDGFNLMDKGVKDTGTVVLKPGETLSGRMRFEVAPA